MKNIILTIIMLLFLSCYQMIFVHSPSELEYLGISTKQVKKVEKLHEPNGNIIYRVYYKK